MKCIHPSKRLEKQVPVVSVADEIHFQQMRSIDNVTSWKCTTLIICIFFKHFIRKTVAIFKYYIGRFHTHVGHKLPTTFWVEGMVLTIASCLWKKNFFSSPRLCTQDDFWGHPEHDKLYLFPTASPLDVDRCTPRGHRTEMQFTDELQAFRSFHYWHWIDF